MGTLASSVASEHWTGAAPGRWTVVVLAAAGALSGVALLVLADANTELPQPGLHAALAYWITIPYIVAGLVAWRRRPDSRLGMLMVAAGFASFLNFLIWSNNDALFTLGVAAQFLPPVLFLHVFLAFPAGRLESRSERAVVAAAYGVAALTIPALALAQESRTLVALIAAPAIAGAVQDVQLVAMSALSLVGIALLARRRRARRAHGFARGSFCSAVSATAFPISIAPATALGTSWRSSSSRRSSRSGSRSGRGK